jgi:hypothetical protein
LIFGEDCNYCLFELDLKLLKGEVGDEVVCVEFRGFFLVEGVCDFDLKEVSDPFGKGVAIFSAEPERLVFT